MFTLLFKKTNGSGKGQILINIFIVKKKKKKVGSTHLLFNLEYNFYS